VKANKRWLTLAYNFFQKFYKWLISLKIKMAEKMQMPSGMGGLVRYFDDYKSSVEFKPIIVIVMIIVVIILEIILHRMGNGWFGLQ